MVTWGQKREEAILLEVGATVMDSAADSPFLYSQPWTKHLKGKTVLIVHGFTPSMLFLGATKMVNFGSGIYMEGWGHVEGILGWEIACGAGRKHD